MLGQVNVILIDNPLEKVLPIPDDLLLSDLKGSLPGTVTPNNAPSNLVTNVNQRRNFIEQFQCICIRISR
jgi:hypothetical protein